MAGGRVRRLLKVTRSRGRKGWGWFHKALKEREAGVEPLPPYDYAAQAVGLTGGTRKAFFKLAVDEEEIGDIWFDLRDDVTPLTVENFARLCTGKNDRKLTYKGTLISQVVKNRLISGGDVSGDGLRGGISALENRYFKDENFVLRHNEPGVLSMAPIGTDLNGSQFLITTAPQPHLNGTNVVFGKVSSGMDVLKKIENVFSTKGRPVSPICIVDCGAD